MRKTKATCGFFLTLLLNLLLNLEWSIPAWILLALHFRLGLPLFWFFGALVLWIVPTLIFGCLIGAAVATSGKEPTEPTVKVKLRDGEKNPFEKAEKDKKN